ncbi:SVF1-like protein YDR222W [Kluyveromyces marxianus]|nr:SVF1-like protein YDR222W [Kluyveromyces marxianus]
MGYFKPVGSVPETEEIYEEICDVKEFGWKTCPKVDDAAEDHALGRTLTRVGILEASSMIMKRGTATKIETQSLYFCDSRTGYCGLIQMSNSVVLGGFHKSFELNIKLFNVDKGDKQHLEVCRNVKLKKPSIFQPMEVSNKDIRSVLKQKNRDQTQTQNQDHENNCIGYLGVEGQVDDIEIHFEVKIGKGFKVKPDGRSFYSSTPIDGSPNIDRCVRHAFAPNCTGSGYISVGSQRIELLDVPMVIISAMQGLKPNNAAKAWNFAAFLSAKRCILCMEFTTPKEYGEQTVTITSDTDKTASQLRVYCGTAKSHNHVEHANKILDPETNIMYPNVIRIPLPNGDYEQFGPLVLFKRFDVLLEVPAVLRSIVEKVEGVNPQLYQFCQRAGESSASANGNANGNASGILLVETIFMTNTRESATKPLI